MGQSLMLVPPQMTESYVRHVMAVGTLLSMHARCDMM